MSNHAIRWKCSTGQPDNPDHVPSPEPPELPNTVPDRVRKHVTDVFTEVLPDQAHDGVSNTKIDGSGIDYVQGVRRFDDVEDKSAIIDEVEKNVVADADWYVIESHVCDHDEPASERTGCDGWTEERTKGTVPEDV